MFLDDLLKVLGPLGPIAVKTGEKLGDLISDTIDEVCEEGKDGVKNLPTKDVKK